MAEAKKDAN